MLRVIERKDILKKIFVYFQILQFEIGVNIFLKIQK